jgi:hypothetical protein
MLLVFFSAEDLSFSAAPATQNWGALERPIPTFVQVEINRSYSASPRHHHSIDRKIISFLVGRRPCAAPIYSSS